MRKLGVHKLETLLLCLDDIDRIKVQCYILGLLSDKEKYPSTPLHCKIIPYQNIGSSRDNEEGM